MNYYEISTKYNQPIDGSDEFKSVKKTYLVQAVSVTDAEATIINWAPSNYGGFEVESVKRVKINQVIPDNENETYYLAKILNDDDGRMAKPVTYLGIYAAKDISEAITTINKDWNSSEVESIVKYKPIVDLDLCNS